MMKLRAIPVFAAAAMLSLAACGGSGEGEAETGDTTAVENAVPVAPPAMGPDTMAPAMGADTGMAGMSHDTMSGMSHDTMATDSTKM